MRNLYCIIMFLLLFVDTKSQIISEIKENHEEYIWGESKGEIFDVVDNDALEKLVGQISTFISSENKISKSAKYIARSEIVSEDFSTVVKTYSSASLNNTERIVISDEPNVHIFRYIKRSDVKKIFDSRKDKIIQFVLNAEKAQKKFQISDALRYYYWAILLLKSHPYSNEIKANIAGEERLLKVYLPIVMNDIMLGIKMYVKDISTEDNAKFVTIDIRYQNRKVTNFDYSYWDGRNWSNTISAIDGLGVIELYGISANTERVKIKYEYLFKGEARIDRELEEVMNSVKPIPFRKSYATIPLIINNVKETAHNNLHDEKKRDIPTAGGGGIDDIEVNNSQIIMEENAKIDNIIQEVLLKIKQKKHESLKGYFTDNGYETYIKLLKFGNARVIDNTQIDYFKYKDEVVARSVMMSFDFKTNNKQFIENVNFCFNKQKKIDEISFGLNKKAMKYIAEKTMWDENDRMILISFLETYKTAYALKRLNFLESIFANDALIITGRVVKVKPIKDSNYGDNKIVKYNKQSKKQFIKSLKHSFAVKEYINLKFEDSKIRKSGLKGDVYGINIKQNYYSSNYGDVGYLFLLVDLNNKNEPIIHIRTWQPDANLKDSIYTLADF